MEKRTHRHVGAALLAFLLPAAAACDSIVEVSDPDVVAGDAVDPARDADAFSRSAFQNFGTALGRIILYVAWFTNEARVGDTFPTRNEFGRRVIDPVSNGTLNTELWTPLERATATSEEVIDLLAGVEDAPTNLSLARAAFTAGYSALLMAETFCEGAVRIGPAKDENGVIRPGQKMDTGELLGHAIARFGEAVRIGEANGTAAAEALANAARVGMARAYLFRAKAVVPNPGMQADLDAAAAIADSVPADFTFEVPYVDNPGNRDRLGNYLYQFTVARLSLVVGPEWRAIADGGDPRVSYGDAKRPAQDGILNFHFQTKYTNWAQPIRLASELEARYIHAEATADMAEQLDLINERRAAAGLPPFGSSDPAAVLAELLYQKGLDFWLEGHRMGDWRRNPDAVPFIIEPGADTYYKPQLGAVGTQTCWPVPIAETDNNPAF